MSAHLKVQFPAIWLIPYVQLKADARQAWHNTFALQYGDFAPQIMTVREWAKSLNAIKKTDEDIHFDAAIDRSMACILLRRAGLDDMPAYVEWLLKAVHELAGRVAAIHPAQRLAWASTHLNLFRVSLFEKEATIGRIALMWAATSSYDTDVLWQQQATLLDSIAHIYFTEGLQTDRLVHALVADARQKVTNIELPMLPSSICSELVASSTEDLVQQTVAHVIAHTENQIALIDLDRQITRRISAMLQNRGITLVDETGWALSTTTTAAQLLSWLNAMMHDATSDDVLAALKTAPSVFNAADVQELEIKTHRKSWVQWQQVGDERMKEWLNAWQEIFARAHFLSEWLVITCDLLSATGLWRQWQIDTAGQALIEALHLHDPSALPSSLLPTLRLPAFIDWVRAVLESSRFSPKHTATILSEDTKRVTILPMSQLWGRHFSALVVPGCDERRLPARPRLLGDWTMAQRQALGLETHDEVAAAHAKAWLWLGTQKAVTLLWHWQEGNESIQKSPLVQILEMQGQLMQGVDNRKTVADISSSVYSDDVFQQGVVIDWQTLAPTKLSASSYADLCACPYRFYATRILGLRATDELDDTIDKRDFGTWLHGVLFRFHTALKMNEQASRIALLDACAVDQQVAMGLDDTAFLPFALVWPQTRDAYLAWLVQYESTGAHYKEGEVDKSISFMVGNKTVQLIGTIDRVDTDGADGVVLLDYKTESSDKTKKRIAQSEEDTQLAFYAALMQGETQAHQSLKAAFVNLVERKTATQETKMHALTDAKSSAESLIEIIKNDFTQIAAGHGLRALGEHDTCLYCSVRGLCRKDFQ